MTLNPKDTDLDEVMFTCRVTTARGKVFEEVVTQSKVYICIAS